MREKHRHGVVQADTCGLARVTSDLSIDIGFDTHCWLCSQAWSELKHRLLTLDVEEVLHCDHRCLKRYKQTRAPCHRFTYEVVLIAIIARRKRRCLARPSWRPSNSPLLDPSPPKRWLDRYAYSARTSVGRQLWSKPDHR